MPLPAYSSLGARVIARRPCVNTARRTRCTPIVNKHRGRTAYRNATNRSVRQSIREATKYLTRYEINAEHFVRVEFRISY